jgi:thioredoxin 1
MAEAIHLTDDMFEAEVLKSDIPVMIDFWAIWCGPCMALSPTVEEIAKEYDGKIKVCKMDVDKQKNVPMQFGIRSIPTLLFFKDGKLADQVIGAVPKSQITSKIDALIG